MIVAHFVGPLLGRACSRQHRAGQLLPIELAEHDVSGFRQSVETFLLGNTPLVFGVELEAVSLVDLISSPAVRQHLSAAREQIASQQAKEAYGSLALALRLLLNGHPGNRRVSFRGLRLPGRWLDVGPKDVVDT